jgi:cobalt-zinc-cadmium efflux system membrane fusion protein
MHEDKSNSTTDAHELGSPHPKYRTRKALLASMVVLAVAVAIMTIVFFRRGPTGEAGRPVPAPSIGTAPSPTSADTAASPHPGDITITLAPDETANAQIKTEVAVAGPPSAAAAPGGLRTTGTVASNAYKETPVFPIAGGVVRQVNVELGKRVKQGQSLAAIFSTELSKSQGDYLKALAEYEEHEREHHRTEQLVEIGAASREELEQSKTKVESMRAELGSSRQQLILLGMSPRQIEALHWPGQINSIISVIAPVSGTVISRSVNPGEVVATGKELFRVADLTSVWVIGQIYEMDLPQVHLGTNATITAPAAPGRSLTGRVSYVDPQAQTAQARTEVPNPGEILKIGMYVDIVFGTAPVATTGNVVTIPKAAIQTIGSKQVVFLATGKPGVFIQREITAGPESGGHVPVNVGLAGGERVVTDGSFLLRAESLKRRPDQADPSRQ